MPFASRREAGSRLAEALAAYRRKPVVVLALPRGGVPVAAEIARALEAPLDLLLVRKIGVPLEPELAMGAIADGRPPVTVRNAEVIDMLGIDEPTFAAVHDREMKELARRRAAYLGDRPPIDLKGHTAIVVDDGVATGATVEAALQAARARGAANVLLAIPVAPDSVMATLRKAADEVVRLEPLSAVGAIGAHYVDFRQLDDAEVVQALSDARSNKARGA